MPEFIVAYTKTGTRITQAVLPTAGAFLVGKDNDCNLRFDQPEISRKHCEIKPHGGGYIVVDLNSANGTFVNGKRITQPTWFRPGCEITIADVVLKYESDVTGYTVTPRQTPQKDKSEPAKTHAPSITQQKTTQPTPVELKRQIHQLLIDRMDLKHTDLASQSSDEIRAKTYDVVTQIVQEFRSRIPTWVQQSDLVKEVVDEAIGLGMLEDLLADNSVDEIMVCNWDKVYVERKGKLEVADKQFTDNTQVVSIIRRIVAPIGRRVDETNPMVDGRLPDGSRVNAIIPPLALSGPTLTIRKFSKNPWGVQDLIRFGSMNQAIADFLALIVKYRANILISGGTGSGKTTLLNITSNYIPNGERIVTVEDSAELQRQQEHVVRLESRPPNLEGKNAVSIRDLVKNCLRMRPDRIVVGECRGGEALDMLQAMNTGHDGSLTTLHANTPRDALRRLETLVLMAGMDLPARAIREQIASAVNFVIQTSRLTDGSRKVTNITEISGMEGDTITMQDIFEFKQEGFDSSGKILGRYLPAGMIPVYVQKLSERGIKIDLSMFRGEVRI